MTILGGFNPNVFQANCFQNTQIPAAQFGYAILVAVSQTGVQGAQSAYIAGSASLINASWFDINGQPFTPNAVTYSIVDVTSGAQIAQGLSLTPFETNQITITSAQNVMISQSRNYELHQVIFEITDGFGDTDFAQVSFDVIAAPPNPLAACPCTK